MDQPIWLQYVINIKIGNGILNNSNMLQNNRLDKIIKETIDSLP